MFDEDDLIDYSAESGDEDTSGEDPEMKEEAA
jgi:hypothetical protein